MVLEDNGEDEKNAFVVRYTKPWPANEWKRFKSFTEPYTKFKQEILDNYPAAWEELRNHHLFTAKNARLVQPLLVLLARHAMKMALPKDIPTLKALSTGNLTHTITLRGLRQMRHRAELTPTPY
jgi:hypothetical protein